MNRSPHKLAEEFVRWWSDPDYRAENPQVVGPNVLYEQTDGFNGEDALWFIRQSPGWPNLKYDIFDHPPDEVRIEGHGRDPITGLTYCLTWRLTHQDGEISSVIEMANIERAD